MSETPGNPRVSIATLSQSRQQLAPARLGWSFTDVSSWKIEVWRASMNSSRRGVRGRGNPLDFKRWITMDDHGLPMYGILHRGRVVGYVGYAASIGYTLQLGWVSRLSTP